MPGPPRRILRFAGGAEEREAARAGGGGEVPVMAMRMKAEDAGTPVAAGELEIRAQVRLVATIR